MSSNNPLLCSASFISFVCRHGIYGFHSRFIFSDCHLIILCILLFFFPDGVGKVDGKQHDIVTVIKEIVVLTFNYAKNLQAIAVRTIITKLSEVSWFWLYEFVPVVQMSNMYSVHDTIRLDTHIGKFRFNVCEKTRHLCNRSCVLVPFEVASI